MINLLVEKLTFLRSVLKVIDILSYFSKFIIKSILLFILD